MKEGDGVMKTKAALYGRVSTRDKQDIEVQLAPLREWAKDRGFEVVAEFKDVGQSGNKASRPALAKLMADARRGRFGVVLVARFDRMARSVAHMATVLAEFDSLGIDFLSRAEAIDTTTPMGKAMYHVAAVFSELERSVIVERVNAGLDRARAKGVKLGRPERTVNAQAALALRQSGLSYAKIAKELGVSVGVAHRVINQTNSCVSRAGLAGKIKTAQPPVRDDAERFGLR